MKRLLRLCSYFLGASLSCACGVTDDSTKDDSTNDGSSKAVEPRSVQDICSDTSGVQGYQEPDPQCAEATCGSVCDDGSAALRICDNHHRCIEAERDLSTPPELCEDRGGIQGFPEPDPTCATMACGAPCEHTDASEKAAACNQLHQCILLE